MPSIHQIIAAISPDIYCDEEVRKKVKDLVKKEGYLEAAKKSKPLSSDVLFDLTEARKDALSKWGLQSPKEEHKIMYDSPAQGIEPIYFWILDFLPDLYDEIEKLTDNFESSAGSGHFSELQGKATQMQQEVSRNMGTINALLKTILNLVYDLKEFKIKLEPYQAYHSTDPKKKQAGLFALKQVWLDNVDIKRGRGSINSLSFGELDFATLGDAFRIAKSAESANNLDLNDQVKRLLKDRVREFFLWIPESEASLKQRYEIEKNYLKSQHNSLKLSLRWVKPYLKAAQRLEQKHGSMQAALVTTFNTMLLELVLLAKTPYKPGGDVKEGLLPKVFDKVKTRKYYSILFVEFNFRGIPQRIQQGGFSFGGRTEVKFTSYSLNEDELTVLKEQMEKNDMGDVMKLIEGATEDSLGAIQKDIDDILEDKPSDSKNPNESSSKEKSESEDTNPFTALFSIFNGTGKSSSSKDLSKGIKPDNKYEQVIRSQAIIAARDRCFTVFDVYKKTHGMASHQSPFDEI
tara:strand:+ start:672 stop:2225 length:1554 start_codon:yes stop_codon:yes gene_type:complete